MRKKLTTISKKVVHLAKEFYFLLRVYSRIILNEAELFLAGIFLVTGVFGFKNGKHCDGTPADFVACTHPSTYYYYDPFSLLLIVLGIYFAFFWFFLRRSALSKK